MHMSTSNTNSMPLVSVLMPVFNAEKHIFVAIQSILDQSYSNFELIILNDGSVDGTQSILEGFSDDRIRIIRHANNQGLITTRNELVHLANGKYIALMDADDIADSSRLDEQVSYLESNLADICGSDHYSLFEPTGRLKRSHQRCSDPDIRALLTVCSPLCNPSIMGRTHLFKTHSYQNDIEVAEDYALWQKLSLAGACFGNIKKTLLTYRVHPNQTSQTKQFRTNDLTLKLQGDYLSGLGINPKLRPKPTIWTSRLIVGPQFLFSLNRQISNISFVANSQIYSRFQKRGGWLFFPITRAERALIALIAYLMGKLPKKL